MVIVLIRTLSKGGLTTNVVISAMNSQHVVSNEK